ncbi:MAG: phage portal protein [Planctomycetota bacterium]
MTPSNRLSPHKPDPIDLQSAIDAHHRQTLPRLQRLWNYYRNALPEPGQPHARSPQSRALPQRLIQSPTPHASAARELVIENDIAWRVHSLVDFMFGKPVTIQSLAPEDPLAEQINDLLRAVFDHAGGPNFFQDLALLGSVYGYCDLVVHPHPDLPQLAIAPPPRAIPFHHPHDYRRLDAFAIHHGAPASAHPSITQRIARALSKQPAPTNDGPESTTLYSAQAIQRWTRTHGQPRRTTHQEPNPLGRVPVVHIQNLPLPFSYAGLSDVEPLIPLQDELNTRLSDRANRVTFQSFKMYLGKGIDQFTERPVGPGQMWQTDNPDAAIEEFGGDAQSPSEDRHIQEIRDALDKTSAVPPLAAGILRGRVGNLSSANAIRLVLLGLLAKTRKKRITYGRGIAQACELILHAADVSGILSTTPEQRRVRLDWPEPIPASESESLDNALKKQQLGVPADRILAELGYADQGAA